MDIDVMNMRFASLMDRQRKLEDLVRSADCGSSAEAEPAFYAASMLLEHSIMMLEQIAEGLANLPVSTTEQLSAADNNYPGGIGARLFQKVASLLDSVIEHFSADSESVAEIFYTANLALLPVVEDLIARIEKLLPAGR